MNLQEFAALKPGDKIENPSTGGVGTGEITETTSSGVRVVWGNRHPRETPFFYSAVGTSWMNWTYAPRDCAYATGPCYRDDCRRGNQCMHEASAKQASV